MQRAVEKQFARQSNRVRLRNGKRQSTAGLVPVFILADDLPGTVRKGDPLTRVGTYGGHKAPPTNTRPIDIEADHPAALFIHANIQIQVRVPSLIPAVDQRSANRTRLRRWFPAAEQLLNQSLQERQN